jgi:hypothetical protein
MDGHHTHSQSLDESSARLFQAKEIFGEAGRLRPDAARSELGKVAKVLRGIASPELVKPIHLKISSIWRRMMA